MGKVQYVKDNAVYEREEADLFATNEYCVKRFNNEDEAHRFIQRYYKK